LSVVIYIDGLSPDFRAVPERFRTWHIEHSRTGCAASHPQICILEDSLVFALALVAARSAYRDLRAPRGVGRKLAGRPQSRDRDALRIRRRIPDALGPAVPRRADDRHALLQSVLAGAPRDRIGERPAQAHVDHVGMM